jgi:hypothetical protein
MIFYLNPVRLEKFHPDWDLYHFSKTSYHSAKALASEIPISFPLIFFPEIAHHAFSNYRSI